MGIEQKVRVIYSGRVQGVGFRMTVRDLAEQFQVVGTVCNVSDGTVELEAAGESQPLIAFLQAIDQRMSRNVENCQLDWLDAIPGEFEGFRITPDKWGGS
jgi:acylphosphatase